MEPFHIAHFEGLVALGIFIVTTIGTVMVWFLRSIIKKIDDLDTEFVNFRKTVYTKFDQGFDQHKEFEGRVSYIEGKTNGKPRR